MTYTPVTTLPTHGMEREEVLRRLESYGAEDADWRSGRSFSLVYHAGNEHLALLKSAYAAYFSENCLNPMAFVSLKQLENDVVRMAAGLLGGNDSTVGVMSSGGTESIMLAVKTYRDLARVKRPFVRHPEIIVPESVHVAFDKAAHYFGVKLVPAPLASDFRVDVGAVRKRMGRNTILIVGSAPCYPYGVVDPIEELAALASERGIPLHVDACLGGFLLPFLRKLGHPVPAFDFLVPGVTSISADLHKYGYAAKGASVILYRSMKILQHQFFVTANWRGGVFASPALLGTRPGGAVAAAWAALMALGEDGYLTKAREVMATTERMKQGVTAIPELEILGDPTMSVLAFRSRAKSVSTYAVGDQLAQKGWHIDRLQHPAALHLMLTPAHTQAVDQYLQDLRAAVEHVKQHPELATEGGAAMYGMIAHLPLRGMAEKGILDMMKAMYGAACTIPSDEGDAGEQPQGIAIRLGRVFLKLRQRFAKEA